MHLGDLAPGSSLGVALPTSSVPGEQDFGTSVADVAGFVQVMFTASAGLFKRREMTPQLLGISLSNPPATVDSELIRMIQCSCKGFPLSSPLPGVPVPHSWTQKKAWDQGYKMTGARAGYHLLVITSTTNMAFSYKISRFFSAGTCAAQSRLPQPRFSQSP